MLVFSLHAVPLLERSTKLCQHTSWKAMQFFLVLLFITLVPSPFKTGTFAVQNKMKALKQSYPGNLYTWQTSWLLFCLTISYYRMNWIEMILSQKDYTRHRVTQGTGSHKAYKTQGHISSYTSKWAYRHPRIQHIRCCVMWPTSWPSQQTWWVWHTSWLSAGITQNWEGWGVWSGGRYSLVLALSSLKRCTWRTNGRKEWCKTPTQSGPPGTPKAKWSRVPVLPSIALQPDALPSHTGLTRCIKLAPWLLFRLAKYSYRMNWIEMILSQKDYTKGIPMNMLTLMNKTDTNQISTFS